MCFREDTFKSIADPVPHEFAAACGLIVLYHAFHSLTASGNQTMKILPTLHTAAHDQWFRAKVQEAIDDPAPAIDNKSVKRRFAAKRAALRRRSASRMKIAD